MLRFTLADVALEHTGIDACQLHWSELSAKRPPAGALDDAAFDHQLPSLQRFQTAHP